MERGTGSFGNAVLNRFLQTDIGEIRIFSRDEKKQDDMRHEFQVKMPEVAEKIKFYIGDVRDLQSVKNARTPSTLAIFVGFRVTSAG
jgi:UDP-glucose 4-epimerase